MPIHETLVAAIEALNEWYAMFKIHPQSGAAAGRRGHQEEWDLVVQCGHTRLQCWPRARCVEPSHSTSSLPSSRTRHRRLYHERSGQPTFWTEYSATYCTRIQKGRRQQLRQLSIVQCGKSLTSTLVWSSTKETFACFAKTSQKPRGYAIWGHIPVLQDLRGSCKTGLCNFKGLAKQGWEVGGWGRDPKKCTGRDWGMGSSTI